MLYNIHIKSISHTRGVGVITGTIINILSIKSMKNPATNTTIKIEIKNISGVRLDAVIISTKILSPSKPLKTKENEVAPSNIMKTIEVSLVVSEDISLIFLRLILPWITLNSNAPAAPIPAASVGDAIPINIEPSTAKIKIKGSRKALMIFVILVFSLNSLIISEGIAGAEEGEKYVMIPI